MGGRRHCGCGGGRGRRVVAVTAAAVKVAVVARGLDEGELVVVVMSSLVVGVVGVVFVAPFCEGLDV